MSQRPLRHGVPVHSCCLTAADFVPYLASAIASRTYRQIPLEEIWQPYLGRRRLLPTPTGRHALWRFLEGAGLRNGDQVLVPAYGFYVIVQLLVEYGLVPVFVDIDPDTLGMEVSDLDRKITNRSRLVLVTHMFGIASDLDRITAVSRNNGLLLFEDCAHAMGTRHGDQHVGQAGDGALFSFGIQKLVTAFGGGLLAHDFDKPMGTGHEEVGVAVSFADTFGRALASLFLTPRLNHYVQSPVVLLAASLEQLGRSQLRKRLAPYVVDEAYRFATERRAPFKPFMKRMLQLQLQRLEQNIARRRSRVERMKAALADIDCIGWLNEDAHGRWNGSYFGMYVPDPRALAEFLMTRRIQSNPYEFTDCSSVGMFERYRSSNPHARYAAEHLIRLPSYPALRDHEADFIAGTIREFLERRQR